MDGDRCQYPQCTGILEEGYCNCCGLAEQPRLVSTLGATVSSDPGSISLSSTRNTSTRNTSTRNSGGLGLGLVSLPPLPARDPEALLLQDPSVPAHKRFCGHCDHPVRRDRGFCGQCGHRYSFVPSLRAGDVVAEQYEVKGAIAYGGLGWIYLGFDRVLSRYVVLKGLLNSEDDSSAAVALAERQFLAAVKHPNIVGVYNFVTHGGEGLIVMEYVAGQTLRQLRRERGPLPVAEAIAYIHGILGAFGYLHNQGLVYCDFKPDNLMLEGNSIKLIDMGAVRRIDDPQGDIYGTVGYSAPEAGAGPTPASDLFTVGRTLAVLVAVIPEFSERNRDRLPTPDQVPLFAQQESLYRFLQRATAQKPAQRFQSAEDMAEQLAGVLREVVAQETGQPIPSRSHYFVPDDAQRSAPNRLPTLLLDPEDPAYSAILPLLSLTDSAQQLQELKRLSQQVPTSQATLLLRSQLLMIQADLNPAEQLLNRCAVNQPADWRVAWQRAQLRLLKGRALQAQPLLEQVYNHLPGELAPQLALAQVAELTENWSRALRLYHRVLQTDVRYEAAACGLARCALAAGEPFGKNFPQVRTQVLQVLQQIPPTSRLYGRSRLDMVQIHLQLKPSLPTLQDLQAAADYLAQITLDPQAAHRQRYLLLNTALYLLENQHLPERADIRLSQCRLTILDLRQALEQTLRSLARLSAGLERTWLVDQANQIRPLTWV